MTKGLKVKTIENRKSMQKKTWIKDQEKCDHSCALERREKK